VYRSEKRFLGRFLAQLSLFCELCIKSSLFLYHCVGSRAVMFLACQCSAQTEEVEPRDNNRLIRR